MNKVKEILVVIRNGLAFIYSWLVICVVVVSFIGGREQISVSFLLKLLALSAWAATCFALCFRNQAFQRKGFIFSLTMFYILFIPIEIFMFYQMKIFQHGGNFGFWIGFLIIIAMLYLLSLLIDFFVMKKRAEDYTEKLKEYKAGDKGNKGTHFVL